MTFDIDEATRRELSRFGFDDRQLATFSGLAAARQDNAITEPIAPPAAGDVAKLSSPGTAEHARLAALGHDALLRGEVGVVVLAGGMATRFGGVVKAAVPVIGARTFLEIKHADARRHNAPVAMYAMTSYATHDRIVEQIRDERLDVECFPQMVSLRLLPDGALFRETDGTPSPYATGHGDLTFALRASGVLARFRERGGKLLFMSNVDNLAATIDPAIFGAHIASGAAVTAELVRKEPGDKGGAPARVAGKPQIVEAFRFPSAFDQDTIPLFNTNTFVFDAAAIDRDFALTFFRVEKKVGAATVIQFERLVGQLTQFLPTHFVEVPRTGVESRFLPAKDPEELAARLPEIEAALRARGIVR